METECTAIVLQFLVEALARVELAARGFGGRCSTVELQGRVCVEPPARIELATRASEARGATMRGGGHTVLPGRVELPAPTYQIGGVTTHGSCQS